MQETYINQQEEMQQCKPDGQQFIQYSIANNLRRIGTIDGQNMTQSMTRLTIEKVGAKKKYIALELFCLKLNEKCIRCQIINSIFTGNFPAKSSTTPAPVSLFSCAVSFTGSRLEDINAALIY